MSVKIWPFVLFILFAVSSNTQAVMYRFDLSDTSWGSTGDDHAEFDNMTFWFEFTDNADLNALNNADLTGMGFDNGIVQKSFYRGSSNIGAYDINHLFGISDDVATLTVGGDSSGALWCAGGCAGSMQIGRGGSMSLIYQIRGGGLRYNIHSATVSHTYYSSNQISQVPVPAAAWLFGSAILALIGFKRSQ